MTLRTYHIRELLAAGKAVARGIAGIGTEYGKDTELTLHAAAHLFQGVQVAAMNVYEQLVPADADATRRDELAEDLGLTFERDASPARGLIAVTYSLATVGSFQLRAGTELTFPGTLFPDGEERTYRLLQDVVHGSYDTRAMKLSYGTGIHKLLPKSSQGTVPFADRDLLVVKPDLGTSTMFAVVRSNDLEDFSLDLATPIQGAIDVNPSYTDGNLIDSSHRGIVVEAECVTPGNAGNAPRAFLAVDHFPVLLGNGDPGGHINLRSMIVEMSGGGDAQGPADSDTARTTRLIEDTLACPPGLGNLQHWRELALSCPDVDLDDAVVYEHARGPGTIDIVCIGRSGSVRSTAFPDAHLAFVFGGNNQRAIGEVQAARVEAWVRARAGYFDDVRVRSMEWDWRGNVLHSTTAPLPLAFVQLASGVVISILARDGYGPDAGVALDITPSIRHRTKLYAATFGGEVHPSLQLGQRVWVAVGPAKADLRHAFATVVTTIQGVHSQYVSVPDLTALCPGLDALYGGELRALRWGTAGPLTQPVLDAAFAYFDQLGPGSYTEVPRGPNYAREFGSTAVGLPGSGVLRWPPESRRWSSSVRESELRPRLLAIRGISAVGVTSEGLKADGTRDTTIIDYEPAVFRTLALTGVIPKYT